MRTIIIVAILFLTACNKPRAIKIEDSPTALTVKFEAFVDYYSNNVFVEKRKYITNKLCQTHVSNWINKADGNRCDIIMGLDTVNVGKRRDLNKAYIVFKQ